MTLKERLIAQKQERLNKELFDRIEERRPGLTSVPFNESVRKAPAEDGVYHKSMQDAHLTDAFRKMKNPVIDKIKT